MTKRRNGEVVVDFTLKPKCPVCKGTGTRLDAKTDKPRTCLVCNGTGEMKWK